MLIVVAIAGLLLLSLFAIKALYLFSASNGLFEYFGKTLQTGFFPNGVLLQPWTTNGRIPALDWQIKAPATFFLTFCGDGNHPDTTLAGISFLGAWGPAWVLILVESFRKCNSQQLTSYVSITGVLIFNHSHALITPLYLALHLATSPSASNPTPEDLLVDASHLNALPLSFVLGYVVPIILIGLPAHGLVSLTFKHTVCGWYQQWNLYIALFHYLLIFWYRQGQLIDEASPETTLALLRIVYGFAFVMAAIPHWVVTVISCSAGLWPNLFNEKFAVSLRPSNVLLPTSPFTRKKASDMAQGSLWLIQWDGMIGTVATTLWAMTLYLNARGSLIMQEPLMPILARTMTYAMAGGPMGVPIGLLWERDEMILKIQE